MYFAETVTDQDIILSMPFDVLLRIFATCAPSSRPFFPPVYLSSSRTCSVRKGGFNAAASKEEDFRCFAGGG